MKRYVIIAALVATPASAQSLSATPAEQAMGQKIVQEVNAGLTCNISLITVQAELDKAKARISELEAKMSKKE